jgi:hypothetical protein
MLARAVLNGGNTTMADVRLPPPELIHAQLGAQYLERHGSTSYGYINPRGAEMLQPVHEPQHASAYNMVLVSFAPCMV